MSEVEILEQRQRRILEQLDDLKKTLLAMRGDLKLCNKPQQPIQQKTAPVQNASNVKKLPINVSPFNTGCCEVKLMLISFLFQLSYLQDVVINANPQSVPYSVLAFKNLWQGRLNVDAQVFVHSSVAEITPEAKEFNEKLTKSTGASNLPSLKVIMIWKDVGTTEMMLNRFGPIYGEVNIIRFLNRVGPNEFVYDTDNHQANLADATLDICNQLSKKLSAKERQYNLQLLSQRLGKSKYLNDSNVFAIADIAVSSIVKKIYSTNMKEVPATLTSWLTQVASVTGY